MTAEPLFLGDGRELAAWAAVRLIEHKHERVEVWPAGDRPTRDREVLAELVAAHNAVKDANYGGRGVKATEAAADRWRAALAAAEALLHGQGDETR